MGYNALLGLFTIPGFLDETPGAAWLTIICEQHRDRLNWQKINTDPYNLPKSRLLGCISLFLGRRPRDRRQASGLLLILIAHFGLGLS
ncbi:hypothetical protein K461DRAFT_97579 [Myriangium duriaei CBS 260.36]|uniref:Uncharacterized protein n=1 Tax=Myriangium duriaei CBS 260.36 TaxID=1168546 RepID=A0A9P4J3N8_9PEZI|nr:hypothetical protein K461DRAFT_97579 [Myriangium duriaei CBS 260.36]